MIHQVNLCSVSLSLMNRSTDVANEEAINHEMGDRMVPFTVAITNFAALESNPCQL